MPGWHMRHAVATALLALGLPLAALTQSSGVLRITVTLTDAGGNATPIPRVVLLISSNPATNEPQRVRTGPDGTVEVSLAPGNYTVESDVPVTLGGQAYTWTQMLDVTAGANTLMLSTANAEVDTSGAPGITRSVGADSAVILNKWRDSIVEIWTPAMHASGFVIDSRGLIATNDQAIGDATAVEVELAAPTRIKVAGRVVASDKRQGVAIIAVDPAVVASIPVVRPDCSAPPAAIEYQQKVVTIVAPMLEPKSPVLGTVGRVEPLVFNVDWRLTGGIAGGPVFDATGRPTGITLHSVERVDMSRRDSEAVSLNNACSVLAAAEKKIAGATPPPANRLRIEDPRPTQPRKPVDPKAPRMSVPLLSASAFDVSLATPAMVENDPARWTMQTDFGFWTEYVNSAPPVLLVRVTPQFEESMWKKIARGAAATQGIGLPPLKSFSSSFLRLRAFCGATEVAPIHPFIIAREGQGKAPVREGLYVFGVGDFGTHCATVRFDLYSEKAPDRADALTVDPKLFARIAQ